MVARDKEDEEGLLPVRTVEEVKEVQDEPIDLPIERRSRKIYASVAHAWFHNDSQVYPRVDLAPRRSFRAYQLVTLTHRMNPQVYPYIVLVSLGFG